MSNSTPEPGDSDEVYQPSSDGSDDTYDLDQAFGDDDVDGQVYDAGYSPPEKPRGMTRFGTTDAEEAQGESLDARLAQEEPDPNLASDLEASPTDENVDSVDNNRIEDEELSYAEVGQGRAGRLVDPDEGLGADEEKDLIGSDVGIDQGAASAEEAAVHIIE
ncbi:DUF5709 domain-containing protein [Kineosporia mesophila]|uniref:DUF5709 domain-containing protein n=1 Tax=Kineosporia mesophila TaxID=566012 RepID=A0ABP6ZQX0_9ACTN|nr:DUF5709 domain-containing protein [Kineosporia mesophila]MCD5349969.1 DUF5709 domain-containing protein [Kineosporia mesophila]